MALEAILMAKPIEFATYSTVRVDTRVLLRIKAAAAFKGYTTISEYLSDSMNRVSAEDLNAEPLKRRPAPVKPKPTGRPRKPRPG